MNRKTAPAKKQQDDDIIIQEGTNCSDEEMSELLKSPHPVRFDTKNKWMKGEQYQHILVNLNQYCRAFGLHKFEQKTHPDSIYTEPVSK
jgi:hypothetical protein